MNLTEARIEAMRWASTAERGLGCAVTLDESLTENFEWGWVFCFVPVDPTSCTFQYKRRRYAVHRSKLSTPVGTKGVEEALKYFAAQENMGQL